MMGGLFRKFADFISYPSHGRTMGILAFLVIVLAIPLTVNIAQKQQELRQRAAGLTPNTDNCIARGGTCSDTTCLINNDPSGSCDIPITPCARPGLDTCNFTVEGPKGPQETACTPAELQKAWAQCGGESQTTSCKAVRECQSDNCWYDDGTAYPVCKTGGATPSTPSSSNLTNGLPCGTQGGKCLSGACVVGGDNLDADPNAQQTCLGTTTPATQAPAGGAPVSTAPTTGTGGAACNTSDICDDWSYADCPGGYTATCTRTGFNSGGFCWQGTKPNTSNCKSGKPTGLTEAQCNAKLAFCSGGCSGTTTKNLGTCTDGRICCQDPLINFPASANTPKSTNAVATPACKDSPAPDNDCPPCANYTKEPTCASGTPVKRHLDGAWFCWDGSKLNDTASCGAAVAKCPETNRTTCQANANTCGPQGKITITFSGQGCNPATEFQDCNTASANCPAPNFCNSSNQCVAQVQGPQTGNTQLTFAIGLDGIGTTGDRKNPGNSSGSTKNPRTPSKSFSVEIYSGNTLVKTVGSGLLTSTTVPRLTYNSSSGKYEGSVLVDLAPGTYSVKIYADKYLKKRLGNVTSAVPVSFNADLVTGAMAGNNFLSAADYGNLVGCLFKPLQSGITFCNLADLDDNGVVNQFDYNLFIREIAVVQNGD